MHIVHISTSLENGGAQAVLYNLLTRAHHDHTVISLCGGGKYGPMIRSLGYEVHCLDNRRGSLSVKSLYRLFSLIRRLQPDLVQTWMYHADLVGGIVSRLAGIKRVVWGIHNTTLDIRATPLTTRLVVMVSAMLSYVVPVRIICSSRFGRVVHSRRGYRKSLITVLASGYDLEQFKPGTATPVDARNGTIIPSDGSRFVLGCVGRWSAQKDHRNLLAACALLRERGIEDFRCYLVGPRMNPANATLTEMIESAGLSSHVQVVGTSTDIPGVMRCLSVHILPSAYGESFPNVVAEAMACGTPCIVTDVGDSAWMVDDTGWTIPARDSVALADAIESALTEWQGENWPDRQSRCRDRAEAEFLLDKMVAGYEQVWQFSLSMP